jgi:Flp pilus assembly pilin Flp
MITRCLHHRPSPSYLYHRYAFRGLEMRFRREAKPVFRTTYSKKTHGAGLPEYSLLTGLIAVISIAAVNGLGGEARNVLFSAVSHLNNPNLASGGGGGGGAGGGGGGGGAVVPAHANCYAPGNARTVGQAGWTGCEGMYIIDQAEFNNITSKTNNYNYDIYHAGTATTYSFDKNGSDIFTGQVTDFSYAFEGEFGNTSSHFDGDISYLDVSNATNFSGTFRDNYQFNGDINGWHMSSATVMERMFEGAIFNQPINNWDVSSVVYFSSMFLNSAFNQDISQWTPTFANAYFVATFEGTPFNQDLSSWDWSTVLSCEFFDYYADDWVLPKPTNFAACLP